MIQNSGCCLFGSPNTIQESMKIENIVEELKVNENLEETKEDDMLKITSALNDQCTINTQAKLRIINPVKCMNDLEDTEITLRILKAYEDKKYENLEILSNIKSN